MNDHDKANVTPIARRFHELGFKIYATAGTAKHLRSRGVPAEAILKVHEGRPNAIDLMVSDRIQLLINTPLGKLTQQDDYSIRQAALQHRVPYTTTLSAASAASDAIIALRSRERAVCSLQEWHELGRQSGQSGRSGPQANGPLPSERPGATAPSAAPTSIPSTPPTQPTPSNA